MIVKLLDCVNMEILNGFVGNVGVVVCEFRIWFGSGNNNVL